MNTTRCRSCQQPIRWVIMSGSGKRMPLDHDPTPDGNIVLENGHYHPSGAQYARHLHATPDDIDLTIDRFVSHFATCPDAAQHRKTRP